MNKTFLDVSQLGLAFARKHENDKGFNYHFTAYNFEIWFDGFVNQEKGDRSLEVSMLDDKSGYILVQDCDDKRSYTISDSLYDIDKALFAWFK